MQQIFNFSSGPAMLPIEVLYTIKHELCNWHGFGTSVMEISHRSKEFIEIAQTSEQDLRDLLMIPDNYKVLFCQGGARAQFAAVPMNLLGNATSADYIDSGYWARSAIKEAQKYCVPKVINVTSKVNSIRVIKPIRDWSLSNNGAYLHYCANETIDGIAIGEPPNFYNQIVVADFSSTILSQPIDVSKFGVIYASAQKNIGPAGLTLIIVREDLLGYACKTLPSTLNYNTLSECNSMFNTPPTFAWYVSGLVFKWLKKQGGLVEINQRNKTKATLLYNAIDESNFYLNKVAPDNRSYMNVPFYLADEKLETLFLKEAQDSGLYALKGHRAVGGMRAALYNAMPLEGVQALVNFMFKFAQHHKKY